MVSRINDLAQRLWAPDPGPAARTAGLLLRPWGWAYGRIMNLRFQAYARGFLKMNRARVPVISVGNLTQGGTGKTPLTLYLASLLARKGYRPAVVLRGYGGSLGKGPVLVQAGDDPAVVGDEALLYAVVPDLLVVAGSDRSSGAELAVQSGAGAVLLDDGFQHLGLARNLDLVLLDTARPLGNGQVFPAGPLREPLQGLDRATALILTRAENEDEIRKAGAVLAQAAPDRPIWTARHVVSRIESPKSGRPLEAEGRRILIAAGVADPDGVRKAVQKLGPAQTELLPFNDHQVYSPKELDLIQDRAESFSADLLAFTSKDLPKLQPHFDRIKLPLGLARLEMELDREEELALLVEDTARGRGRIAGVLKKAGKTLRERYPQGGRMVIRMPNWLGDAVMATPVLDNLRAGLPDWTLALLLDSRYLPLFQDDPRVDELIAYDPGSKHRGFKGRRILAKSLKDRFEAGLLLTNSLDSAFVFWLAEIDSRTGYGRDGRSLFLTDPVPFTRPVHWGPQADSYLGLLDYLGLDVSFRKPKIHLSAEAQGWADDWLAKQGVRPDRPLIGIAPGAAFGPAKAWPAGRYAQAGRELSEQAGAGILIFGSGNEQETAQEIAAEIGPRAFNLAGQTTLDQAAGLISGLDLMVANDSGLMHLAAGLGVRQLVLFGPTDPLRCNHSLTHGRVLWRPEECSPCYKRVCPRKRWCLENITVEEVVETALSLLPDRRN